MKLIKNVFKITGKIVRSAGSGLVDGLQSEEGKARRAEYRRQNNIQRRINNIAIMAFISIESFIAISFMHKAGFNSDSFGQLIDEKGLVMIAPFIGLVCVLSISEWISKNV